MPESDLEKKKTAEKSDNARNAKAQYNSKIASLASLAFREDSGKILTYK